jgi:predicted TIM-barrel fold metal-dependent hydrolase
MNGEKINIELNEFYRDEVAPILPAEVLDFHTHAWSDQNWKYRPWETGKNAGKYMVTTEKYLPEQLDADRKATFPDRPCRSVVFGYPTPVTDVSKDTEYIAAVGRTNKNMYPLMLAGKPLNVDSAEMERLVLKHGFFGFKVFLNWLGDDYGQISIEDMLSENEMSVADKFGLVVMLHVPRSERLADPEIQRGVIHLSKDYPNASIVLAHCGRCYLPNEMKAAIKSIESLANVWMDTSMVMDPLVIQIAMEHIGPQRLLYATDFPVAAMRGRRVRVMNHWVDVVLDQYPNSAYRVKSNQIKAAMMSQEIVVAIRDAAERAEITDRDFKGIFFDNGMKLLRKVNEGKHLRGLEDAWLNP